MEKRIRMASWMVAVVCVWGAAGQAHAGEKATTITRDSTYEQYLHYQSNPDEEKITPARVIRWMMGMRGHDIMPRTAMEFQPAVDADQHRVRAVAAIAYKFF